MTYVYLLSDQQESETYVGTTNDPRRRYNQHMADARRESCRTRKADFIRSTLKEGGEIVMSIISLLPDDEARELERQLIYSLATLNTKHGG